MCKNLKRKLENFAGKKFIKCELCNFAFIIEFFYLFAQRNRQINVGEITCLCQKNKIKI